MRKLILLLSFLAATATAGENRIFLKDRPGKKPSRRAMRNVSQPGLYHRTRRNAGSGRLGKKQSAR